jgi:hypothetical protein
VHFEILSQYFNLAAKLVVRTLDQLKFALVFVGLNIGSQSAGSTFILALDYLKQTALIMSLTIFVHQHRHTLLVLANYSTVATLLFVQI